MSDLKKLDSITLEMSKNYLIRTFLRNGRLRVKFKMIHSHCKAKSDQTYERAVLISGASKQISSDFILCDFWKKNSKSVNLII